MTEQEIQTQTVQTGIEPETPEIKVELVEEPEKENPTLEVPIHLKNPVYEGERKMGKGKDYKYAHNYKGGFAPQEHLTQKRKYYIPKDIGFEKKIKLRMEELMKRVAEEKIYNS